MNLSRFKIPGKEKKGTNLSNRSRPEGSPHFWTVDSKDLRLVFDGLLNTYSSKAPYLSNAFTKSWLATNRPILRLLSPCSKKGKIVPNRLIADQTSSKFLSSYAMTLSKGALGCQAARTRLHDRSPKSALFSGLAWVLLFPWMERGVETSARDPIPSSGFWNSFFINELTREWSCKRDGDVSDLDNSLTNYEFELAIGSNSNPV